MPTGVAVVAVTERITAAKMNLKLETVDLGDAVNAASAATTPSLDGLHIFALADTGAAPSTGTTNLVLDEKERVVDAWAVKTAGTGVGGVNTVQVQTGAGVAITNAMDIAIADTLMVRCASIDDAQHEIAGAGTLRVYQNKGAGGGVNDCILYVKVLRVA